MRRLEIKSIDSIYPATISVLAQIKERFGATDESRI